MEKIYLPPGKNAPYPLEFNRDLDPGMYTIVMTVNLEDDHVAVKEIDFNQISPSDIKIVEIRD